MIASGNVYVADWDNSNRIVKWVPNANQGVDLFGYVYGEPHGIKLDSKDNIYVSYLNNRTVEKFQPQLDGTYSRISLSSDFNNGSLNRPLGIYIDEFDNVYVADRSNHRIEKLQQSPEIEIVAGSTTGAITFKSISDISYEDNEKIIVTPSTSTENATSTIADIKTLTITDDDTASSLLFSFSSPSIDENSSTDVTLTATLNEVSGRSIEIPFTVGGTATETTEFTVSSSSITIAPEPKDRNCNNIN